MRSCRAHALSRLQHVAAVYLFELKRLAARRRTVGGCVLRRLCRVKCSGRCACTRDAHHVLQFLFHNRSGKASFESAAER